MRRLVYLLCVCLMWSSTAQDDAFPPGRDFYVEAVVSDVTPYLNEQIIYTFRYYTHTMPSGFFEDLPDFRGFWLSDVYELTSPRVETINGRQYNVFEVYALISPTQTGTLAIQPSVLEIPETLFREAMSLATEALDVSVLSLPDDAPDGFNGAVGQFSLDVEIDLDTVSVGQPVRLSVTLSGSGNFEQLTAPDLPPLNGWRVYPEASRYEASSIGGLQIGEKTFEWLLIPDRTGTQAIPPIMFNYFDPQSSVYRSLSGESQIVEVFPGEAVRENRPEPVEDNALALIPITSVAETASISSSPVFWLLWLVAPLFALGTGAGMYGRRWWQTQQIRRRRKNALTKAVARIHAGHIEAGVMCYFKDKTNNDSLHYDDLCPLLEKKGISSEFYETLAKYYVEAQTARYAPVPLDIEALKVSTVQILGQIDSRWV